MEPTVPNHYNIPVSICTEFAEKNRNDPLRKASCLWYTVWEEPDFDLGTATTAAVLDRNGCMIGGAIAAGLSTTRHALSSQTAQLPLVDLEAPDAARRGIVATLAIVVAYPLNRAHVRAQTPHLLQVLRWLAETSPDEELVGSVKGIITILDDVI